MSSDKEVSGGDPSGEDAHAKRTVLIADPVAEGKEEGISDDEAAGEGVDGATEGRVEDSSGQRRENNLSTVYQRLEANRRTSSSVGNCWRASQLEQPTCTQQFLRVVYLLFALLPQEGV